jgi:hypothetical protein
VTHSWACAELLGGVGKQAQASLAHPTPPTLLTPPSTQTQTQTKTPTPPKREFKERAVKGGDKLDLGGGHELEFVMAPNLHWWGGWGFGPWGGLWGGCVLGGGGFGGHVILSGVEERWGDGAKRALAFGFSGGVFSPVCAHTGCQFALLCALAEHPPPTPHPPPHY